MQEGRFPGEIILTTNSHEIERADQVIYIEPALIQRLCDYMLSVQTQ